MRFSVQQFAAALPGLRPELHKFVSRRGFQSEDAEDLVEDAICLALENLHKYNPETGAEGLLIWVRGFILILLKRRRRIDLTSPKTVPIEAAASVPAPPPTVSTYEQLLTNLEVLPRKQRDLMRAWLEGYSHRDLAAAFRIHPNTVGSRLAAAVHTLRLQVPNGDILAWFRSDFDDCSRVTLYHRPVGVWRPWKYNHPPERRPRPAHLIPANHTPKPTDWKESRRIARKRVADRRLQRSLHVQRGSAL